MNSTKNYLSREIDKEIASIHTKKDGKIKRSLPNCSNSLPRLINRQYDVVSRLNYFDYNNSNKETLFNLNCSPKIKLQIKSEYVKPPDFEKNVRFENNLKNNNNNSNAVTNKSNTNFIKIDNTSQFNSNNNSNIREFSLNTNFPSINNNNKAFNQSTSNYSNNNNINNTQSKYLNNTIANPLQSININNNNNNKNLYSSINKTFKLNSSPRKRMSALINFSANQNNNEVYDSQKAENQNFETQKNNQIKKLQEKLYEVNFEIEREYETYVYYQDKQDDVKIDLELLINHDKLSAIKDKAIIQNITNNKSINKRDKEKIIQEKLIIMRQTQQKQHLIREEQLLSKKREFKETNFDIVNVKNKLNELKSIKEDLKKTINEIKNELVVHYHKILSKGLDARKEGLSWIIQEIWNLGEKVQISFFPSFLDEFSVQYLFKYTEKNLKYYRLKKKLDSYKVAMKANYQKAGKSSLLGGFVNSPVKQQSPLIINHSPNVFENNNPDNNSQIGILNENIEGENNNKKKSKNNFVKSFEKENQDIYEFKSWLKKMNYYKKNEVFTINNLKTIKEINEYLDYREGTFGNEASNYFVNQKEMEEEIEQLKTGMNLIKKDELARLFKELIMNEYERRFRVRKEDLFRAIVGEENATAEMANFRKEYFKYHKNLKKTKLFSRIELTSNQDKDRIKRLTQTEKNAGNNNDSILHMESILNDVDK